MECVVDASAECVGSKPIFRRLWGEKILGEEVNTTAGETLVDVVSCGTGVPDAASLVPRIAELEKDGREDLGFIIDALKEARTDGFFVDESISLSLERAVGLPLSCKFLTPEPCKFRY